MSTENIINNNQILLPPQITNKKTLVLDLDETLVHSQFLTFSKPSDIVIPIEIENEIHDIHVMVRPGVKEFLKKMEKLYEIVIFTASVSKYADPLLDIIDKKGYCPYRLFREHCSLINTTFVKDLKRLGRELKNIIIVDNSPLSYAFHPKNGIPILTWFEDKNDRELYEIIPILEFLSNVPDVRDFIPKFVEDNKINYEKVNEFIKNYKVKEIYISENKNDEKTKKHNNYKNNEKEINIEIINNNTYNNYIDKNSINNDINNKENKREKSRANKDNLVEMEMKNIIASVNPNSFIQNDPQLKNNKGNSKNKIISIQTKNKNKEESKINNKENHNIKIDTKNNINVNKLSNANNTAHSTKKFKISITDGNFKSIQKRKNYSMGGNYIKNGSINLNSDNRSIVLKSDNNINNILAKQKIGTPKSNKTINLLNKSNHTTRSVKYTKKTNTYIVTSTLNHSSNNHMPKSLTKDSFNRKYKNKNNNNNENVNKNNKKIINNNNNVYKSLNSISNNHNGSLIHKKQKSTGEFRPVYDFKNNQFKYPVIKNKKIEINRNKNNFLKNGFIQYKAMNKKMNINLSNNLSLSTNLNNHNHFGYSKTNRGINHIKFTLNNSNVLKTNFPKKYSPNNRYNKKPEYNNILFYNNKNNENQYSKIKTTYKNNSVMNIKGNSNDSNKDNKINNNNHKINGINLINKIKTTRPKSSSTAKFENKIKNQNIFESKKNKVKYKNKMKFEINEILQKSGISGKIIELKNEIKKSKNKG